MALVPLLVVAAVAALLWAWLRGRVEPPNAPRLYRETPYVPWLGSLWQFAQEPTQFLLRGEAALGECFDVQLFGQRMTFLMSSEGHDFFFQQPEEDFDASDAYKFTVTTFGPGVCYDAPPKLMYQQFGFLKTGLEAKKFYRYTGIIQHELEQYFAAWGDAGERCMFTALNEVFTLTSSHCLMGPEIRAQWHASYAGLYQDLDKSFIPILFFFPNIPHPFAKKVEAVPPSPLATHPLQCLNARTIFEGLFKTILAEREKKRDQNIEYSDFLDVLVNVRYKDGTPLTLHEITGVMVGVLLGGQHTSNVTGTWLLLHLLEPKNKRWLDAVMEEQKRVLGSLDPDTPITMDHLNEMHMLQQCLDETLRLHPPFFQLVRRVQRDIMYKDTLIPKGRLVAISPAATQRLPQFFSDPHVFDPSRFAPENKDKLARHSWVPYGGGRHQCTGKKFAITSLKTATSWLLRNFRFSVDRPLPAGDYTTMVVAPAHSKGECRVRYTRIKSVPQ